MKKSCFQDKQLPSKYSWVGKIIPSSALDMASLVGRHFHLRSLLSFVWEAENDYLDEAMAYATTHNYQWLADFRNSSLEKLKSIPSHLFIQDPTDILFCAFQMASVCCFYSLKYYKRVCQHVSLWSFRSACAPVNFTAHGRLFCRLGDAKGWRLTDLSSSVWSFALDFL